MRLFKLVRRFWMIIVAYIVATAFIGGALWYRAGLTTPTDTTEFDIEQVLPAAPTTSPNQTYTTDQLATFNGRDGKQCYVAIDQTVYEIKQGTLWQNGQHTTSGGQAMCGKDLTEVIKQSPHGRSKLEALPKVGTFTK